MTQLAASFDTDPIVTTAYDDARRVFESWALGKADPLPSDRIDAMQIQLIRWQRASFGDQSDERYTLGVIEEMAEGSLADSVNEAVDALGDVCVYGSQLATNNRLAIRPIIHLAESLEWSPSIYHPIGFPSLLRHAYGVLAQVTLKSAQRIRGYDEEVKFKVRLVGALAICIAHVRAEVSFLINDVAKPNIAETLLETGHEVMKRSAGHDAIPKLVIH